MYNIKEDSECLDNLALKEEYQELKKIIWSKLENKLEETDDRKMIANIFSVLYNIYRHYPYSHSEVELMNRLLLQIDDRGRITIPVELRKKWNIESGDYLVIDPDAKKINKANIFTDEELKDPKVVKSILQLGKKAKEDFYKGETININNYVAENDENNEY